MVGHLFNLIILLVMLVGLPLLGVYLAGLPVLKFLQFPPKTLYVVHAPFSWCVFIAYATVIATVMALFTVSVKRAWQAHPKVASPSAGYFPWWGWLGVASGMAGWILAWSRFPWFSAWQTHTFTPLWLSFIVVINALTFRRSGTCLMINRTRFFLLLFPVSALFWWFFEYLNRFVQNWHYLGPDYDALQYFVLATLPFSTVLPAVLSVRGWLLTYPLIKTAFAHSIAIRPRHPKTAASAVLVIAAAGLAMIGIFPNYLFSLPWLSPGLIIVSVQTLQGKRHILSGLADGDWTVAAASALSALFCGCFWEMWNHYSLAKWHYSIPFVDSFHVFAMPILGYAGYLPFGLECAAVGDLVSHWLSSSSREQRKP